MTLRAAILDALSAGPLSFPALRERLGAKPESLMFALHRAYDAGLIQRSGTRRNYVYALVDGDPTPQPPRERMVREPVPGADLASVWR